MSLFGIPAASCDDDDDWRSSVVGDTFAVGDHVQVFSMTQHVWLRGIVCARASMAGFLDGVSLPQDAVKVRIEQPADIGEKWILPEHFPAVLRKDAHSGLLGAYQQRAWPERGAALAAQSTSRGVLFRRGEAVETWSESCQEWLQGVVKEVPPEVTYLDNSAPPAGIIQVALSGGRVIRHIPADCACHALRRLGPWPGPGDAGGTRTAAAPAPETLGARAISANPVRRLPAKSPPREAECAIPRRLAAQASPVPRRPAVLADALRRGVPPSPASTLPPSPMKQPVSFAPPGPTRPELSPSALSVPGALCKGEAVELWSGSKNAWLPGIVIEVDARLVRVSLDGGVRLVPLEQAAVTLRRPGKRCDSGDAASTAVGTGVQAGRREGDFIGVCFSGGHEVGTTPRQGCATPTRKYPQPIITPARETPTSSARVNPPPQVRRATVGVNQERKPGDDASAYASSASTATSSSKGAGLRTPSRNLRKCKFIGDPIDSHTMAMVLQALAKQGKLDVLDGDPLELDENGRPVILRIFDEETGKEQTIVENEDGSTKIFGATTVQGMVKATMEKVHAFLEKLTDLQIRGFMHEVKYRFVELNRWYAACALAYEDCLEQLDWAYFGLTKEATRKQLDTAYRRLAKAMHPDKNGGTDGAKDRFQKMKDRYERMRALLEKRYLASLAYAGRVVLRAARKHQALARSASKSASSDEAGKGAKELVEDKAGELAESKEQQEGDAGGDGNGKRKPLDPTRVLSLAKELVKNHKQLSAEVEELQEAIRSAGGQVPPRPKEEEVA